MPEITDATLDAPAGAVRVAAAESSVPTSSGRLGPRRLANRGWYRLITPIAVLLLWQLASSTGLIPAQKLPPPTTVWHTAVSLITTDSPAYGTLQGAMLVSLQRMAIGFAFGAVAAIALALVAGLSRLGENAVDPLLQILRTLPLFGLIPVFIVWFGIGELPKVILIALGAAIPLYLNTFAGIRGVDARLAEAGQTLGLRRTEMIRHVILPGALPQALVGLRQSLGVGLACPGGRRAGQRERGHRVHHQPGDPVPPQRRDHGRALGVRGARPAHRRSCPAA
jgi:sulfonate transport system permease protein